MGGSFIVVSLQNPPTDSINQRAPLLAPRQRARNVSREDKSICSFNVVVNLVIFSLSAFLIIFGFVYRSIHNCRQAIPCERKRGALGSSELKNAEQLLVGYVQKNKFPEEFQRLEKGEPVSGALHINQCPAEQKLPLLMIALGAVFLAERLITFVCDCQCVFPRSGEELHCLEPTRLCFLNLLFCLTGFALVVTMYLYARNIDPTTISEDQGLPNYCNNELYLICKYMSVVGVVFICLTGCMICANI